MSHNIGVAHDPSARDYAGTSPEDGGGHITKRSQGACHALASIEGLPSRTYPRMADRNISRRLA